VVVLPTPARYKQLKTISPSADTRIGQLRPEDAQLMVASGMAVETYALYFSAFDFMIAVVAIFIALLVAWNRPDDRFAMLVSLMFISLGMLITSPSMTGPHWQILIVTARIVFFGSLIPFIYLFPNGLFVPSWTRWLAAAWLVYTLTWIIFPVIGPPLNFGEEMKAGVLARFAWILIWLLSGVLAQIYRYLRISNSIQRQQTKWVVLGFITFQVAASIGVFILAIYPFEPNTGSMAIVGRMAGISALLLGMMATFVTIGISVLRYRLWDIDVIIRQTLVYSSLTAVLALAYIAGVLIGQQIFGTLTGDADRSPIYIVMVTLGIAMLFNPLRKRIQTTIDRRFYRQKYDAQKVLTAFSASMREEVDLDQISQSLRVAVEKTVQPDHFFLWLRPPSNKISPTSGK